MSTSRVLILRLRGRGELGGSVITLLHRYADDLQRGGGSLLLVGVGEPAREQLARTGLLDVLGEDAVFPPHSVVYQSTEEALAEGRRRLQAVPTAPSPGHTSSERHPSA